jgi:hypothetical protein
MNFSIVTHGDNGVQSGLPLYLEIQLNFYKYFIQYLLIKKKDGIYKSQWSKDLCHT